MTEEEVLWEEYKQAYDDFKDWSKKFKRVDATKVTPHEFDMLVAEYMGKVRATMNELTSHSTKSYRAYWASKAEVKRVDEMVLPLFTDKMTKAELHFYEDFRRWSKKNMRVDPSGSSPRQFEGLVRAYVKWIRRAARNVTWVRYEHERNEQRTRKAEAVTRSARAKPVHELKPERDEPPKLPNVRKERLVKIAKVLRWGRDKAIKESERIEGELSPLLGGIKPQNMATQTFLYDPEGETQRRKLAWLFLSKGMRVPMALIDYLNTDFVLRNIPRSKIGGMGKRKY